MNPIQQMILELEIEIAALEEWIGQLGLCLNETDDQDENYITLLLQEAGALEYLQELIQKLEELKKLLEDMNQNGGGQDQQQQQQGGQRGGGGQQEQEEDGEEDGQGQGGSGEEESEEQDEGQGQGEEQDDEGNEEGQSQGAGWDYDHEIKRQYEGERVEVPPAPSGVCKALWDLIGEDNYNTYKRFAPVELSTRVQKGTIAGREYSYKIPRPDGKTITRRSLVQRVKFNGRTIKLSYVPEIHTIVYDF